MTKSELEQAYSNLINVCEKYGLTNYSEKLKNKMDDLVSPLKVMIVGEGKSGKSSLLNALVGADIAEVAVEPKTWCINIYTYYAGESYVELVYRNLTKRVSVKKAQQILYRINSDFEKLSEEEKSLIEMRWYLNNLIWPSSDICIIDTPGFGHVDLSLEEVKLHLGEGIHILAKDGFDKYYYKADLVLWCLYYDSLYDSEIENHLKQAITQDKKVYGIITKLDCIENEREREAVFKENVEHYKKYNFQTFIKSMLPPIYRDDEIIEKQEKVKCHDVTSHTVRNNIEALLKDVGAERFKVESSEKYLHVICREISSTIGEILDCYYQNMNVFNEVLNKFIRECDTIGNNVKEEFETTYNNDRISLTSDSLFNDLWIESESDLNIYKASIERKLSNCEMAQKTEFILNTLQENMIKRAEYIFSKIEWKTITINLYGNDGKIKVSKFIPPDFKPVRFNTPKPRFNQDAFTKLYEYLKSIFGNSKLLRILFKIDERTIRDGKSSMEKCLNEYKDTFENTIENIALNIKQAFKRALERCLLDLTCKAYIYDVKEHILEIEKDFSKNHAFFKNDMVFYPVFDYVKSKGNRIIFLGSYYSRKLGQYPIFTDNMFDMYVKALDTLFKVRSDNLEIINRDNLCHYNGTERVNMGNIDAFSLHLQQDSAICEEWPKEENIDWNGNKEKLFQTYEDKQTKYLNNILCKWKNSCKAEERILLEKKGKLLEIVNDGEIKKFCEAWGNQVSYEINGLASTNNYYELPRSLNYYTYYINIYCKNFGDSMLITYLYDYEKEGVIPKDWQQKYKTIGTDGNNLEKEVQKMIGGVMGKMLKKFSLYSDEHFTPKWDSQLTPVYEWGTQIYNRYFSEIEKCLEDRVKDSWEKYKTDQQNDGKIKDILTYALKAAKLSKKQVNFLNGNASELLPYETYLYCDGTKMKAKWREYKDKKFAEYMKEWKEM